MPLRACFLDVDGVILDPTRTHLEWVRLMGDVLAPALGREPAEWGRANAEVFPRVWSGPREVWHDEDPLIADRRLSLLLLHEACRFLDVPLPDEETAAALSRRVDRYVYQNTRAAFPGAAAAIRTLATSYELHTATGNSSWRVEPLLEQLGVRQFFGVLCGPDLIGAMKPTAAFYERLFDRAGVQPSEAVVVDDQRAQLAIASRLGARTVLVGEDGAPQARAAAVAVIDDLPSAVAAFA